MRKMLQGKADAKSAGELSDADMETLRLFKELTKFDVRDKVILITGGSRGIGLAVAKLLAQRGAKIALCARTPSHLGQAQVELEQMGAQVATFVADVTKPAEVRELLRDVMSHYYGQLDVLINNAGIARSKSPEVWDLNNFEQIMKANFWASLYTMFAAIPIFQKQGKGRIVNITLTESNTDASFPLPYTASKLALRGVSEEMQNSLKQQNINITIVVPDWSSISSTGSSDSSVALLKATDACSTPVTVTRAAQQIVHALEHGIPEVAIQTKPSRAATGLRGSLNSFLSWVSL